MMAVALKEVVQSPLRSQPGMIELLAQALLKEAVVKVWDDISSTLPKGRVEIQRLDVLARQMDGHRLKAYRHQIEEAVQTQKVGA